MKFLPFLLASFLLLPVFLGAGTSTVPNPKVTFATPGTKTVTLTVCSAPGRCSTLTKQLQVLDPRPAVVSALASPSTVESGKLVRLSATGRGKPPLAFRWQVLRGRDVVAALEGATAYWSAPASPGPYSAVLTLTNASGSAGSLPVPIAVVPSAPTAFYTVPPCRLLDTRTASPLAAGGVPLTVGVSASDCGIPAGAAAIAANVTAVSPTAAGHVALYPGNYPPPSTSTLNFRPGLTRANNAVLPLANDGSGTLAAVASLPAGGTVHLLVDVSGYFLSESAAAPIALDFRVRACAFGFCIFPRGVPLSFAHAVSGIPTGYRYDWDGNGVYEETSSTPVVAHVYATPGTYAPRLQVLRGLTVSTFVHAVPISIQPDNPAFRPPAPVGLSATFAGLVPPGFDPTRPGFGASFALAVTNPPGAGGLLAYNVYLSINGGSYRLVSALAAEALGGELLVVPVFDPTRDVFRIVVTAVNFAAESAPSPPVLLSLPPSLALEASGPQEAVDLGGLSIERSTDEELP